MRGGVVLGALVMVLTQLVMVAIMTMTPVHMHDHGHGTAASGLVIAIHIGAVYLPSPLTDRLVDRHGRMKIAAASGITLLAAGLLAGAGATGGMASGIMVTATSYPVLALTGGVLSLALLPAVAATAYHR